MPGTTLRRTLELLERPPHDPDIHDGYLDLLGATPTSDPGRIQRLWLSQLGSGVYDAGMRLTQRFVEALPRWTSRRVHDQIRVDERLGLRGGETVLDLGCGPGNLTRECARAVGSGGLVVGLDVSPAMLRRCAGEPGRGNLCYVRADATRPPFGDASFDALCSSALLQLLPEPFAALDEIMRLLKPGGRVALLVPSMMSGTPGRAFETVERALQARLFRPGELRDALQARGFVELQDRSTRVVQIVDARKPE